jgi:hypothetical protein
MSGTALQRRTSRTNNDAAAHALIYDGASVNQIAAMFGMNNTEVARKLRTLAPSGVRSGYPIYHVKEAAEYLLKPRVDVEEYIRKVGMKDLPTTLQKDLWAALNGQLKFEEAQGAVFRAERVMEAWAEWMKMIRMRHMLAVDAAERDGVMPPELFEWFRAYMDDSLRALKDAMVETMDKMGLQTSGIIDYDRDDPADTDATQSPVEEDDEL